MVFFFIYSFNKTEPTQTKPTIPTNQQQQQKQQQQQQQQQQKQQQHFLFMTVYVM